MKTIAASFALLISLTQNTYSAIEKEKPVACLSTREFITTLEFLRDHKEFGMEETDARSLSHRVSEGCTGASKRFIQITNLLIKAGVPSKLALETGHKFSSSTDEAASAFLTVFKGAFIETLLDLNVSQALELAMELSYSFEGNKKLAEKNFNQLVNFCMDKKSLDLPVAECARISSRVIKNGSNFDYNIGSEFIALFNYLTKEAKTNLPTYEAIKVSEFVTKYGPQARNNFVQAYEYAVSKSGLDRPLKDAIEFGKTMASRSVQVKK